MKKVRKVRKVRKIGKKDKEGKMTFEYPARVVWTREDGAVRLEIYRDGEREFPHGHLLISGRLTRKEMLGASALLCVYWDARADILEGLGLIPQGEKPEWLKTEMNLTD